mgnify:FL=1
MKKAPTKMKKAAPTKKIIDTSKLSGGKRRLVEGVAGAAAKMKKSAMTMKKAAMKLKKESAMKLKKSGMMMKKSAMMMKKAAGMKMKKK